MRPNSRYLPAQVMSFPVSMSNTGSMVMILPFLPLFTLLLPSAQVGTDPAMQMSAENNNGGHNRAIHEKRDVLIRRCAASDGSRDESQNHSTESTRGPNANGGKERQDSICFPHRFFLLLANRVRALSSPLTYRKRLTYPMIQ